MAINGNSYSQPAVETMSNIEQQQIDDRMRAELAIIRGDANVFLQCMLQGEDHLMDTWLQRKPEIVVKTGSGFDPSTNIQFSDLSPIQYSYWLGDQARCDRLMENAKQTMTPNAYSEFASTVERQISELRSSEFCRERGRSYLPKVMLEMREQIQLAESLQMTLRQSPNDDQALQQFTQLRETVQDRVLPEFYKSNLNPIASGSTIDKLIEVMQENHNQLETAQKQVLQYRSGFAEKYELPSANNRAELR